MVFLAIPEKALRVQLALLKPFIDASSTEVVRAAQDRVGELMSRSHENRVRYSTQVFRNFVAEWVVPKAIKHDGVVLYLHGGGYVTGDLEYAKGFGTILAARNGIKMFCPAYRLAPEHPFPAALDDAVEAYRFLLDEGYEPERILLCGESAGGGLCYALALRLKELQLPMPRVIIAMSPWTDLTMSGESFVTNEEVDPSLSQKTLAYYADAYAKEHVSEPLVSPLFGDLTGLPPSLIFAGGSEILLDDSVMLCDRLIEAGCTAELHVEPNMWHVYVLYGVKQAQAALVRITEYIEALAL